jgi:protein arginine N-methyltransferase 1
MSQLVDEHRQYLADQPRLAAYRQAIEEIVKPDDVVVDLGAGTGILGLLACQAGARRVYSIDSGGMLEIARAVCEANGFTDRLTFIRGYSEHVTLPEPADVVVADQIGRFGFEAGVVQFFMDARRRFLKPGGTLIPHRIELHIAPIEHPELWSQVEFWTSPATEFKLDPVRKWATNMGYPVKYQPEDLLGDSTVGATVDLTTCEGQPFKLNAELTVRRAGTLHGIGGWFVARLSANAWMTNSPLSKQRINRHNVYFPIEKPVTVEEGDRVEVEMTIMPSDVMVTWRVKVTDVEQRVKGQYTHTTWKGMLTAREDLQRTRPDFVPQLTPRGQARMTVLRLCDGHLQLAQIEQEVYRQHLQLFRSPAEAALFVAEVVTRYTSLPSDAVSNQRSHAEK